MLLVPTPSEFAYTTDNWGTNPSTSAGALLTAGAANVKGSWVQIASALARDIDLLTLHIFAGAVASNQKDFLLDVGVDRAGGTSYTAVISNVICGESSVALPGTPFRWPLFIPAGSTVALRVQSNSASATCRAIAKFLGSPTNPEIILPRGQFSETVGTVTNSGGVSITPGNAADGSWTLIGTTVRALWWWQLGFQVSNSVIATETAYVDLGYGDGTTFTIIQHALFSMLGNEQVVNYSQGNLSVYDCVCPRPPGTKIYARARCSGAPTSGYNVLAYGMGG